MAYKGYVLYWLVDRKDGVAEVCRPSRLAELQKENQILDYRPHKWGTYAEMCELQQAEQHADKLNLTIPE